MTNHVKRAIPYLTNFWKNPTTKYKFLTFIFYD